MVCQVHGKAPWASGRGRCQRWALWGKTIHLEWEGEDKDRFDVLTEPDSAHSDIDRPCWSSYLVASRGKIRDGLDAMTDRSTWLLSSPRVPSFRGGRFSVLGILDGWLIWQVVSARGWNRFVKDMLHKSRNCSLFFENIFLAFGNLNIPYLYL